MHDAAEESSDDDKDAVSPDDRRDGARGGDSYRSQKALLT